MSLQGFWLGFEKAAGYEQPSQAGNYSGQPAPKQHHWGATAAAAAGAGALTYGLLRGKKPKTSLTKVLEGHAPKTRVGRWFNNAIHGADQSHHISIDARVPRKATKVKGTVLHEGEDDIHYVRGDKNIGAIPEHQQNIFNNKLRESRLINQISPSSHTMAHSGKVSGTGRKNLEAIHKKHKGKPYLIKPLAGENSGVGGASFIHSRDVEHHLKGGKLSPAKQKALNAVLRKPGQHVVQRDIGIAKSPLTNRSSEFRVHAVDGKVVRGASSARSGNVEERHHMRRAEEHFQQFLDKMPAKHKKNTFFSPDMARTHDGKMKIVEMNAGAVTSGLIDPLYQMKKRNPLGALNAVKNNQAIYKHITGRASQLEAGTKAVGAAGLVGTGVAGAQHLHDKHRES